MSALDNLFAAGADPNAVGSLSFIDADTIRDPDTGEKLRLQGYDAPEINRFSETGENWKSGTAGSAAATSAITALARDHGFTNIHRTGQKDPNGREIIELRDAQGRNFTKKLLASGVLDAGKYTKQEDLDAIRVADVFREQSGLDDSDWGKAATAVSEGIISEAGKDLDFKEQALNEAFYAAAPGRLSSAVQFRHRDRSIMNDSLNPFSDSWEQGWIGVKEASYGMLNLLGETTGAEWLEDLGDSGVTRARSQIQQYGDILTDWKEVNDIGSAFDYVTNNAALSLPYMALSIGGALAAPVTGGVSLAAPAAVYAGQTWNEQTGDSKNAGIAIGSGVAQAALDRIGLGFIFKSGVAPTKLLNEAVENLVKKGATEEAAKAQVFAATRKELAGFVGDAAKVARAQTSAKAVTLDFLKKAGVGAAGETVTEALQEATGYLAAHNATIGTDAFNWDSFKERVIAGAIAGGALGGTFAVPGSVYNTGAWADVAVRQAPADAARLSRAGKHAEAERRQHGRVQSIPELIAETKLAPHNTFATDFNDKADAYIEGQKGRSVGDQIFDAIVSAPALWRGATRTIFHPDLTDRSRSLRILSDMFGGGLQKTFSGSTFENEKHHRVTVYKGMIDMPNDVWSSFNDGKVARRKDKARISNQIYTKLRSALDEEGNFNPDLIPDSDPHKAQLVKLQRQLQTLSDKMYTDQKKHNPELGHLKNYLLRYKSFDKGAIYEDRQGFTQALQEEFNMPESQASEIWHAITSNNDVNDISDALETIDAARYPGSHKRRSLDLAEKDRFKQYMNQDLFANVSDATRSAARYTANQDYVGDNQSQINALLEGARQEGISEAEVNKIAKQMRDYLAAESGNYKRPESDAGKRLQRIQRNFMMVTTLAGLPLATISSFVEAALTMRGLTMDQMFGKGGLSHLAHEFVKTLWSGMGEISAVADRKQRKPAATAGKEAIQNLGFYDWDVGAATTTGVTEVNPHQKDIYEMYFKATGLQGWTNFTRAARAAIAGDYIIDKLNIITGANGQADTNEVQEAREALRNLGINVDDVAAAYIGGGQFDPNQAALLEENFREGSFNFVNDAVALPQAANRPLIYQDPRFALFTQFQGFIATFTANHIPKLWGEYVSRGTPAMKYNAFATMATMIMLGFASQYLKDLIKYGDLTRPFGPDDHPFLDNDEYIQRGIRASGLLGTGERVLDQFFPLYEERSDGVGDWVFNQATGESPALGYAKRGAKGVGNLVSGDVGGAAKEASRFVPFAGVLNFVRDKVEETGSNWNFNGE